MSRQGEGDWEKGNLKKKSVWRGFGNPMPGRILSDSKVGKKRTEWKKGRGKNVGKSNLRSVSGSRASIDRGEKRRRLLCEAGLTHVGSWTRGWYAAKILKEVTKAGRSAGVPHAVEGGLRRWGGKAERGAQREREKTGKSIDRVCPGRENGR